VSEAPDPVRCQNHPVDLGPVGIWWSGSWAGPDGAPASAAADMERLGYGTLWSSAGFETGLPDRFAGLLDVTERVTVATGILSIWHSTPDQIAAGVRNLGPERAERFLLGLGASHGVIVEALGTGYVRPYSKMVQTLDSLDGLGPEVAKPKRMLAALGPRMLELAAERSAGAHPYFVPLEHIARAREIVGPGPLLAPELAVVLDTDPETARATARSYTEGYLTLPNYVNNLLALGFTADDVEGGGSDRLVDAVVAWGDAERIAERVRAFRDAGADHVCVQVVGEHSTGFPSAAYETLAAVLLVR
jgi:probable F420-dependent oxidoreductase